MHSDYLSNMEATRVIKNPLVYPLAVLVVLSVQAYVPPPTNVTLHCRNFVNILYWNYSQPSLRPRFRIDVGAIHGSVENGHQGPLWVDSPHLHGDISSFADPKNDYYLTLTAVVGQNESDVAPDEGITFSYFKDSPSDLKCFVDFPPVNITVQSDDIVEVRFLHPSLLYHQMLPAKHKRKQKKHQTTKLSEFTYIVETKDQKEHQQHHCMESVCEQRLAVDGGQESPCVRMHGHWEQVAVRSTKEYCASALPVNEKTSYTPVYIVVALLIGAAIGLIFFMVYRKQTRSSPSLPDSMKFPRIKHKIMGQAPLTPEQLATSQVHDSSPTVRPLLQTRGGEEWLNCDTPGEHVLRLPIGVQTQDGSVSGGMEQPAEEVEGPAYMLGRELDGDVEERERGSPSGNYGISSGYEQRDKLVTIVEIAPGDKVEGYHG